MTIHYMMVVVEWDDQGVYDPFEDRPSVPTIDDFHDLVRDADPNEWKGELRMTELTGQRDQFSLSPGFMDCPWELRIER